MLGCHSVDGLVARKLLFVLSETVFAFFYLFHGIFYVLLRVRINEIEPGRALLSYVFERTHLRGCLSLAEPLSSWGRLRSTGVWFLA